MKSILQRKIFVIRNYQSHLSIQNIHECIVNGLRTPKQTQWFNIKNHQNIKIIQKSSGATKKLDQPVNHQMKVPVKS